MCLDAMQVDQPAVAPGEEADVESEGGPARSRSKSQSSKDANGTVQVESNKNEPVEIIDDDEDEDGDEETFAVEKVLNHRIAKKGNVRLLIKLRVLTYDRVNAASNFTSSGCIMIKRKIIPGKMKKTVRDRCS
jgi:hypothetical protein